MKRIRVHRNICEQCPKVKFVPWSKAWVCYATDAKDILYWVNKGAFVPKTCFMKLEQTMSQE